MAVLSRRRWLAGAIAALVPAAACRGALAAPADVNALGARGDGITDDTLALQAALAAFDHVRLDGHYRISDALTLRSGQVVELSPRTLVRQERADRNAFLAKGTHDVSLRLNGGTIRGAGGWSTSWTGNQGWEGMRGVRLAGCTAAEVIGPGRLENWANAAIDITGGSDIACRDLTIEGTHRHGQPLVREANFQNGIYITNDRHWGAGEAVTVTGCDLSGMAQGILREAQPRAPAPTRMSRIADCLFHDIPGQHGIYNMDGMLTVSDCRFVDVALSAVKNQVADAGRVVHGLSATGIVAERIAGSLFEVAEVGGYGGGIDGIALSGRGDGVGYLVSLNGRITDARVDVQGTSVINNAVYALGRGMRRVSVIVDATDIGQDGVLITAPDAEITVTPTIRRPNGQRRSGGSAIRISSAGARVTILHPNLTDTRRRMAYGLFNDTAGAEVRVRGTVVATGAADTAVRATGRIIEFPASVTLEGAHGRILGAQNIAGPAAR